MTARLGGGAPLQLWGGVECTVNRVGDRYFDQLTRSGHRHRLDDFDRFAALGLRKLRMPVLWESIERVPEGAAWRWVDAAMSRMRALRMEPIVGLVHHGSGPADTSLVDPAFPEKAARHARAVAERYPDVVEWTPINEPLTTARFAALYGHWYPHARSPADFVRALLGQVEATAACMRAIRRVSPRARLVQTEDFGRVFGTTPLAEQVRHETERRFLGIDLLCGRVDRTHPLWAWLRACGASERALLRLVDEPCPPDIVGINYYVTSDRWLDHRCDRYPPWTHGGNGRQRYADVEAVRVIEPSAVSHLEVLLEVWQRYRRPVALTEVHIGCSADERARWLVEGWRAACDARDQGADVRGVTAWALLGSYDWDVLVRAQQGHYEPGVFDISGREPRATPVAALLECLGHGRIPADPALAEPGWWRRPERLLYPATERAAAIDPEPRSDRVAASSSSRGSNGSPPAWLRRFSA
jgi:dTDP-4-dehydrorhamnose reductase